MPTLFRDVFTGDEMFDSSHEKNIVDDIVYSVQGCYTPIYTTHADGKVTVRTAIDIVEKHDLQVHRSCPAAEGLFINLVGVVIASLLVGG
eukprot:SAG31_NODE_385_length_16413_cov_265.286686_2_plen_90_part_00